MTNIKDYIQWQLNEEQFKAATWKDTSSLILAWAWSWKTRTLTYKIAYLIFWLGIKPYNILAVTFTNKAAWEMKERLHKISEEIWAVNFQSNMASPVDDFDALISWATTSSENTPMVKLDANSLKRVWTFHSIFLKVLKEDIEHLDKWYNKNFWVYDETETMSVVKQIINELKLWDKINHSEVRRAISTLKCQNISPDQYLRWMWWDFDEYTWKVYEKYQNALVSSNSLDFDDLLLLPNVLFDYKPEVLDKWKKRFKYILVDEAQDTNHIQFELIRKLTWKEWNVTFIWDDFQSIYGWRWAVMDNFLNVAKWWPNIEVFKLEVNYRSKPHIVEAWNHIIAKNSKQYVKNVRSNRTWEDKLRLFSFSDETDEAINIVNLIKKFKDEKNMSWGDFAILYRTNAQSQPFEKVLLTDGIPYKIWGWFKFFERKEIKDIISYVKFIVNPRDSVCLRRIINTPNRKIWETTIEKLNEYSIQNNLTLNEVVENVDKLPIKISWAASESIKQFNTIIKFIKSNLENATPAIVISQIVSNIKYKDYMIAMDGTEKAEERMENIWQLINMASSYDGKWSDILRQFLEEVALMTDLEENSEWNLDAVKLMSVHASKWLEFPLVFIVWLEENVFPLSKAKFSNDELEEERRLMYVAITRAKDIIFLSYANSRQQWGQLKYNSPSRFLDEIPMDLLKSYDLSGTVTKKQVINFDEWDEVRHKLFGDWEVVELWNETAVVRFYNPKYWTRKIDVRFLNRI